MLTRREFIRTSGIAALPLNIFENWRGIYNSSSNFTFDMHCHPRSLDTFKSMVENHLNGAFIALVADLPLLKRTEKGIIPSGQFKPGEAWKEFESQLEMFDSLLDEAGILPARTLSDFLKVAESGTFVPLMACEGGDFLEGSTEYVDRAYEKGLRSVQLVHYVPNDIGDLQTFAPQHNGLSGFGKQVVKRMNELGMVIDLAHASFDTVKGVVEASSDPVILSHSILKRQPFMPISARALTEDHAKLIAENGGVIGMWPSGLSTDLEDFTNNTIRMIELVGIDHVGIGTDMDANYKPVINNYEEFFQWSDLLLSKGLNKEEVTKVSGGNVMRLLKKVLK